MRQATLRNGTRLVIGPSWVVTTLPGGAEVHAHPEPGQAAIALSLGYGGDLAAPDLAAMTRDHDPLHALLTDWLGLPASASLSVAAGLPADAALADLEEAAVLAVQRFMPAAGAALPLP